MGVQLRGGFGLGSGRANYALFAANGPRWRLNSKQPRTITENSTWLKNGDEADEPIEGEFEIHGLETEGFVNNDDGDFVFGGRLGYLPWPTLRLACRQPPVKWVCMMRAD